MKKHDGASKTGPMKMHEGKMAGHYFRFGMMIVFSFISMYVLMYAMVDVFADVYSNVNQFYMAGLMTAPMILIEVILMGGMYPNKKVNLAIIAFGLVALVGIWLLIRDQTAVSEREFLKSMIPHHSGAILMCKNPRLEDPEIRELCREISVSQRREIDQMNRILERK